MKLINNEWNNTRLLLDERILFPYWLIRLLTGELLLLLLLLNLGGLSTDLSGTSERTVHLT